MIRILISGPQGSGKTTQAKVISGRLGLHLIRTGDLLRVMASQNSAQGEEAKSFLDHGKLADDDLVAKLVQDQVVHENNPKGFIIDGYPRRLSQLDKYDPQFDVVIYLNIPQDIAIQRMLGRGRNDDTKELIEERLRIFNDLTSQVVDHYRDLGKVIDIDSTQSIEKVEQDIEKELEKYVT